jgi:transaldolase
MSNPLIRLGELGQSPWYDFITRDLVTSGELARLVREDGLLGMTSNPSIFEKAIATSALYDADIAKLAAEGKTAAEIFEALAVHDVQLACDVFRPVFDERKNGDGTVSLEVSPELARDTEGTIAEAMRLWAAVDRPNVMIKVPGTVEGLDAVRRLTAAGVSVNVTLLFSAERYAKVADAYLTGLEERTAAGRPIDGIHSVASFFISRVDTKIDPILDKLDDQHGVRGHAAIANACAAYEVFQAFLRSDRWQALSAAGANPQRPLWASTSTKDPKYPDVYYVEALAAPRTVNTLPPETFAAYRDHGDPAFRMPEHIFGAPHVFRTLAEAGVDFDRCVAELEQEGVEKFVASFRTLLAGIDAKAGALAAR